MDIKKSTFMFGGLTLGLSVAALYAFWQDYNSLLHESKMVGEMMALLAHIEEHFKSNTDREKV